jgi:hypothetical protein
MLAVLAISLFSWGLGYKLSLYHSEQCRSKMAQAKLLSQKERPASAQASKIIRSRAPNSACDLTLVAAVHCPQFTPVLQLEARFGDSAGAKDLFTVHTDRKPPPNSMG